VLVLGIETATSSCSVALVDEQGLVSERTLAAPQRALEWLVPAVEGMLRDCDVRPLDVQGVAVSAGPGSFTGLRIGIATAVGWARARGVPACGVPTLLALAAHCAGGRLVAPVLDARRGEMAAALFLRDGDRWRPLVEELVAPPEVVIARFRSVDVPPDALTFLGDGLGRYGEPLRAAFPKARFAPRVLWTPRAATVAALGRERLLEEGGEPLWAIQPRYGRAPSSGQPIRPVLEGTR
jgi:tRNA threonylcarbamoyladenosine biosynthesis protein TsaB